MRRAAGGRRGGWSNKEKRRHDTDEGDEGKEERGTILEVWVLPRIQIDPITNNTKITTTSRCSNEGDYLSTR